MPGASGVMPESASDGGQAQVSGGIVLQLAVDSAAASALYGLIAAAVWLARSGSGVVHRAVGEVAMAGALTAAVLAGSVPLAVAVAAGLGAGAAVSAAAARGLVLPAGDATRAAVLLVAGAAVLRAVLQAIFPRSGYGFPVLAGTLHLGDGVVHASDLLVVGAAVALIAATAIVLRTPLGARLRLTAASPQAAERLGVSTGAVRVTVFAMAGAVAAGVALVAASRLTLAAGGGTVLVVRGLAAAAVAATGRSPRWIAPAVIAVGAAQAVGVYALGSGGEVIAGGVAVLCAALGGRRR